MGEEDGRECISCMCLHSAAVQSECTKIGKVQKTTLSVHKAASGTGGSSGELFQKAMALGVVEAVCHMVA
eukprot:3708911-Karenia_brevis.AAC.1